MQIHAVTDDDILTDTLAAAGFELNGDMLSGEPFEVLDEWGAVADAARDLSQKIGEIARLYPDLKIGFECSSVFEFNADSEQVSKHQKVYAQGATSLAFAGYVPGVAVGGRDLTPEEKAEQDRMARATKAAELLRATMVSDTVLEVLRLFEGEPWGTELGHVHDLIQDDMNGELSAFATEKQLTRFNRSINHQDVLGLKARHATLRTDPPRNPMSLDEATKFIQTIAEKWIQEKARRESAPRPTSGS